MVKIDPREIAVQELIENLDNYKICMKCGAFNIKDNELCWNDGHNSFKKTTEGTKVALEESLNYIAEWDIWVG